MLMASYKLIQDIEADDKLLGPLSFRQFIYALVTAAMLYFSYLLFAHHAAILMIATLPIALFAGFLAYPFGKDQPTEIWVIAKLRFFLKPRRRIWAQSGVKELVTITVPKRIEIQRTDGLSQNEVKSRLQALANTIDSRGWAIKNVDNVYQNPLTSNADADDRLISVTTLPQDVPEYQVPESEDLFDETANPIAQQVNQLLSANTSQHHQQILENLNSTLAQAATKPAVVGATAPSAPKINLPPEPEIEQKLKAAYVSSHSPLSNMHALRHRLSNPVVSTQSTPVKTQSTPASDPVIMNLSQRNDLNVSVISREADRAKNKSSSSDEVLISLH